MSEPKFKPGDLVRVLFPGLGEPVTRIVEAPSIGHVGPFVYSVLPVYGQRFGNVPIRQFYELYLERDVLGELAGV